MKNFNIKLLLIICYWIGSMNLGFSQKLWNEQNGYVIIEVEDVDSTLLRHNGWKLEVSPKGYSGKGYLKWMGTSLTGHDKEKVEYKDMPDDRKIIYQVKITKPGKYYWRLRNIHLKEDGDNDVFVSVNKVHFRKTYDWDQNAFTWDETGKWASAFFERGIINFEIAGRSHGFGLDRIVLFHQDLALPEDQWPSKGPYQWMDTCIWAKPLK